MAKKLTRLEALQDLFKEHNITSSSIEKNDTLIQTVKGYAEIVTDYRHQPYVRHSLASIIMVVFFAVLANADEWAEIEIFAKKKERWLHQHLDLPCGIPTDDTYRIVIGNIDTEHFFQLMVQLLIDIVNGILDISGMGGGIHEKGILSVDGKASCGSGRKETADGKVRTLQTLNVYSGDYGICLAQKFIDKKTNEIPAVQEILRLMDLRGTIVTADAMNCQKETAAMVADGKGDYVLAPKGNQALFYDEVKSYFDDGMRMDIWEGGRHKKTAELEHGGIAIREYYITEDTSWFSEKRNGEGLRVLAWYISH